MTLTAKAETSCEPDQRVTRSLLGYGVIAGPIYVLVSVTQALTRAASIPAGTRGACSATAPRLAPDHRLPA